MCVCARVFNGIPIRWCLVYHIHTSRHLYSRRNIDFTVSKMLLPERFPFVSTSGTQIMQTKCDAMQCNANPIFVKIEFLHGVGHRKCMRFIESNMCNMHIQQVKLSEIDTHCITILLFALCIGKYNIRGCVVLNDRGGKFFS